MASKTKRTRVGLYARVSTCSQETANQLSQLREYVERRGWEIAKEYRDDGVSGIKTSRPGLDQLMADAKKRKFDVVLVWSLCRYGRSLRHLVTSIDDLGSLGVGFVAYIQGIDTSNDSPTARLTLNLLACIAEYEREMIKLRVEAGLARARAQGKRLGRPPVKVDERRVLELRAAGRSIRSIAKQLGVTKGVVCRVLRDQAVSI